MARNESEEYLKAMSGLNSELSSGSFRGCYLFYGDEAYLRAQNRDNVRKAALGDSPDINLSSFSGSGTDVNELTDLAQTLPFLGQRRVIVVDDSGLFKSGSEILSSYLKDPSDSTCLIFAESEVDKRRDTFKAVTAGGGLAIDCCRQDRSTLFRWVKSRFKGAGKEVSQDTIDLILDRSGNDMFNIAGEIEKLICYSLDRNTVTREDVNEICSDWVEDRIFEMIDAAIDHNNARALSLYADLLSLGDKPMRIMSLITRQLNLILQTSELSHGGARRTDIMQKLSLPEFVVRKQQRWADFFTRERLTELLDRSLELDHMIKTGKLSDQLAAELLIVELSRVPA